MNPITIIRQNSIYRFRCGDIIFPTCTITKFIFFRLILPFETQSANLASVSPGNDCVVHPSIHLTYLGRETEIIVPLFAL